MGAEDTGNADELVMVAEALSTFECDAIVALLESCGVTVHRGARDGRPGASTLDDNRVFVRHADAAIANEVLSAPPAMPE
jgi:hypothetical protein